MTPVQYRFTDNTAAENGHAAVVHMMLSRGFFDAVTEVLVVAAGNVHIDVVVMILERGHPDQDAVRMALRRAAYRKQYDTVQILAKRIHGTFMIRRALLSAVYSGYIKIVKLLAGNMGHQSIKNNALVTAASSSRLDIMEVLINSINVKKLDQVVSRKSITDVLGMAAATRSIEMPKLMLSRCEKFEPGNAVGIALQNNDVEMLTLLVVTKSLDGDALLYAVDSDELPILEHLLFLLHIGGDLLDEGITRLAFAGNFIKAKLMLEHCNPTAHTAIFENAASCGRVRLVQLLQDRMDARAIESAIVSVAGSGHEELVKVLAKTNVMELALLVRLK